MLGSLVAVLSHRGIFCWEEYTLKQYDLTVLTPYRGRSGLLFIQTAAGTILIYACRFIACDDVYCLVVYSP